MGPEIALAASAREWPDRVHRFLLDHGGGRVRSRVMGPEQAAADQYDVLLIDDVCSFLTPRLVRGLRDIGREIVGVYSPTDGPDAKRHLLECGITDVIEADASPEEFLSAAGATLIHRTPTLTPVATAPRSFRVGVFGPIGGVGVTEVAIGVSSSLARSRPTLLIDLDQHNPSVAQRLDLPLHPNLLTAVDLAHHSPGDMAEALLSHGPLDVVGGLAGSAHAHGLAAVEIDGLLDELADYQVLVADLGSTSPEWLDLIRFHVLIAVGLANPIGITRLLRSIQVVQSAADPPDTVAVINRVEGGGRRRLEIRSETARLMPEMPVVLLPEDRRLERAAWDGSRPEHGPFARSVGRIASLIDGAGV